MAPIRVALIGLSSSAKTSWAAQAHLPYLLSPKGKSHYKIVALLNSSVQAAEAAREYFGLPTDVKAYGDRMTWPRTRILILSPVVLESTPIAWLQGHLYEQEKLCTSNGHSSRTTRKPWP